MVAVVSSVETPEVSVSEVSSALTSVRSLLGRLDASLLTGAAAVTLAGQLVAAERCITAARLAVVLRAADCSAFPRGGDVTDAADWAAKVCGTTRSQAAGELRLADRLDRMEPTRAALVSGRVSLRQAEEIAATEEQVPGSQHDMLRLAQRADLASLREEGRRRRQKSMTPTQLRAKQLKARHHRSWINELGMTCGTYALMPEDGVPMHSILNAETDRRVRAKKVAANQAAREGRLIERQRREQHAADAFLELMGQGTTSKGKTGKADVVLVGDIRTLLANDDAVGAGCHIVGAGPIPVEQLRDVLLAGDAFIKGVVHDGVDILHVQHFGRHIPAPLLTALRLGDPPDFDGPVCVDPSCGRRHGLEVDHDQPVAAGGLTTYANLKHRCWANHQTKTEADRQAGLLTPRNPADAQDRDRSPP